MKKVLVALSVIGTFCLSACQKEELIAPELQTLKADKGISCRGCGGSWDITGPEEEGVTAFSAASYDGTTDTVSTVPTTPVKKKR